MVARNQRETAPPFAPNVPGDMVDWIYWCQNRYTASPRYGVLNLEGKASAAFKSQVKRIMLAMYLHILIYSVVKCL